MNIKDSFKVAFRSLLANKFRSILTILGIIIGVAAVIIMVSIGAGAKTIIEQQISAMGTNLLIVVPGATTSGGIRMGMGTAFTLTMDDAEAIGKEVPTVSRISPVYSNVAQVVYGNQNWSTAVMGTTEDFLYVRDWSIFIGRPFLKQEIYSGISVCIIGQTVVENLFGMTNPLNKIIRIKSIPFRVIGVLSKKGQSLVGQDQDDTILIPITTAQKRLFGTPLPKIVRMIYVKVKEMEFMDKTEKDIKDLLRQRHNIKADNEEDFTIRNLTQMMGVVENTAKTITILLGSVALVSLLVGGIGIMNIMLVSVTERTKEIGIRISVGARDIDILMQFIIESAILSIIGGIIGILIGIIGSFIITQFFHWKTLISVSSVIIAFVFSGFIGIFFGFYPAKRASSIDPIEALRYG